MNFGLVRLLKHLCLISVALLLLSGPAARAAVLTKGVPARIMCVGDSITEGKFTTGGYRLPLLQMLTDAGYSVAYVGKEDNGDPANDTGFSKGMTNGNHEGYGSMRIDEILDGGSEEGHTSLPIAQTVTANKPDVVLVMLGTNDVMQSHDLSGMLPRLDALVGRIFATRKSAVVLLAQITPLSDPARDAVASAYDSGMPLIAAKYKALGDRIAVVDMHGALDASQDLAEGVHPNESGYKKMAAAWFAALTGIAPPAPASKPVSAVSGDGALRFSSAVPDAASNPFSLGFSFTTGAQSVTVTRLGYLNDGATGDNAKHSVGIYDDATKTLITPAVTVTTSGGNLTGTNATFTYIDLPMPVTLKPTTTYAIAGTASGTGFIKAPKDAAISYGIPLSSMHAVFAQASTLTYPASSYAANDPANIGPNFIAAK